MSHLLLALPVWDKLTETGWLLMGQGQISNCWASRSRSAWRGEGEQAQVCEDRDNKQRIFDGSDDPEAATTVPCRVTP